KLAGDGVVGITRVDQRCYRRSNGNGVFLRHSVEVFAGAKTGRGEISDGFDGGNVIECAHSATGAHSTASIRGALVASMTSRSKPSATPLASGINSSAARKSSSSGYCSP